VEKQDRRPPDVAKPSAPPAVGERLNSLDTYRGLTMILLAFTVPNYDVVLHVQAREVHYTLSDEVLVNPERGFYQQFTAHTDEEPLKLSDLKRLRERGLTLLLRLYYLESFRDADLSDKQLEMIASDFIAIRKAGYKCILRFAYSNGQGRPDAPLKIVLRHIEQLKPLLQDNADVIAVMQAGFIGAWGEWHGSTNGLETDEAMRTIVEHLLDALPATRCIQVRTPRYKRIVIGNDEFLTSETAFDGTSQARIAHHNDCFLASETDVGTYEDDRLEWDKRYVAMETRFVPMGGETCGPSQYTEYEFARRELARMHWTYLNQGFHRSVIRQWKENGLYAEADKLLGYRLTLVSSLCDVSAVAGAALNIDLKIKNVGWAAPINPREVTLLLKAKDNSCAYQAILPEDPRRWLPGEATTIRCEIGIPESMTPGEYKISLRLSDPEPHLKPRGQYAIQLANQGLWNALTAEHDLQQTVEVIKKSQLQTFAGQVYFQKCPVVTSAEDE
jgi:hypothetical protein